MTDGKELATEAISPAAPTLPSRSVWDSIERVSKALSIVAIPITVAIVGWILQDRLSDKGLKRDYVQIALSILKDPESSKIKPEIRDWAVDLLNENSPTKFSPAVIEQLKSGNLTLSTALMTALAVGSRGNVAVSPDGRLVLVAEDSGGATLWNLASGQRMARWRTPAGIISVAFSPDGRYGATGDNGNTARIWDVMSGRELAVLRGHTDVVTSVVFSPDGRTLLTSSLDGTIKQWDVVTGRELRTIAVPSVR